MNMEQAEKNVLPSVPVAGLTSSPGAAEGVSQNCRRDAGSTLHCWLMVPMDAVKLTPLYEDMLREIAAYGFPGDPHAEAKRRIETEIWPALRDGVGYVASDQSGVGVAFNVWRWENHPTPMAMEIALYVAPDWRRKGVARLLRNACLTRIRQRAEGRTVTCLSSTQAANEPMNALLVKDMTLTSVIYTAELKGAP